MNVISGVDEKRRDIQFRGEFFLKTLVSIQVIETHFFIKKHLEKRSKI